jgi:hypothetical protein
MCAIARLCATAGLCAHAISGAICAQPQHAAGQYGLQDKGGTHLVVVLSPPPPKLPSPHGNDTPWRSAPPAGTAAPKANSLFALQPPAVTRTQQRGMPTTHHKAAAPGVLTVRATVAAIEQGPSQVDAANAKPPKHWCSCRRAPSRSRTCAAHVTPVSCQRTLPCMPTAPQQQGVLHVQPRNNHVPTTPVCSLGQASSAC